MNITEFFNNPIAETFSAYTDVMGVWFYAAMFIAIGGYVLIKTESWAAASGIMILGAILFSAVLPSYIIFIWAIAAAFTFAAILIEVLVLK